MRQRTRRSVTVAALVAVCTLVLIEGASAVVRSSQERATSVTTVDFGKEPVGALFSNAAWIVNTSGSAMQLGPIGITERHGGNGVEAFGLSGGTCFQSSEIALLQPGASCSIGITFSPPRTGVFKGELLVAVDDFASTLTFELRGAGSPS